VEIKTQPQVQRIYFQEQIPFEPQISGKFTKNPTRTPSLKALNIQSIAKIIKDPVAESKDQCNKHYNTSVFKEELKQSKRRQDSGLVKEPHSGCKFTEINQLKKLHSIGR
jgi:hypothetical protein